MPSLKQMTMKRSIPAHDQLRTIYTNKRKEIRRFHQEGGGGLQVVRALSDLADSLLLKGFQKINPRLAQEWNGCLIALGGYGRQELSPYSDIDLMFLYRKGEVKEAEAAASEIICLLWDLGYKVGHSTRTVEETVELSRQDPMIATSLLEARFLHGDRTLFKRFHSAFFLKVIDKNIKRILTDLIGDREGGRAEYGATPYLLEPNLKQSPGGLRDIHHLKWVASARYRTHHLPQIHQWGHLSNMEYDRLTQAQDFLWRIRNHLHFLSEKASDHLTIERQEEIAPFFDFHDRRELMRKYYLKTGAVLEISKRFTREAIPLGRRHQWSRPWKTRQVAPGFRVFSGEIFIQSTKPFQFFDKDENIFRLFLLAKTHEVRIADAILEVIHQISEKKRETPLSPGAISLFKTLMTEPGGIANNLRHMHRLHLLWRIIPEFADVHCMVQESRSHAFTVDEHSFRAVEAAEKILFQEGPIQKIYAAVQRKDILHLAILLHDIGKGGEEAHSKVGAKIAETVAQRLGYSKEEGNLLVFLVERHLIFSDVALYRDFANEPILLRFVKEVGRIEALRKLFILTCADIRATAPGMWTAWKGELLLKLYGEASHLMVGEASDPSEKEVSAITDQIYKALQGTYPDAWLKEILSTLIPRYFLVTPFDKIRYDLSALSRLQENPIKVEVRYLVDHGVAEYTLYTYDWITSGIFSGMVGVLAAKGLKIIAAQVFTHPNGMVIDTFQVIDPDHEGSINERRVRGVREDVEKVLTGKQTVEQIFAKNRRFPQKKERLPLKKSVAIEIDNHSSHTFTVIDITAADRRGLLYVIAKTLVGLELVVHAAKIATRLEQAADIFYVLGPDQKKIVEPGRLKQVKERLVSQIQAQFELKGQASAR